MQTFSLCSSRASDTICSMKMLKRLQGFPSGLLNKGPRDSICGVKGSLIMIQGFIILKRLKLLQILIALAFYTRNTSKYESIDK